MSAWTVYWLFKLDDIQCVLLVFSLIVGVAMVVWTFGYFVNIDSDYSKKEAHRYLRLIRGFGYPLILAVITMTFMPSTKTMAAIIVLPRIASSENLNVVSKDAGDIYKLAMVRLKEALGETASSSLPKR